MKRSNNNRVYEYHLKTVYVDPETHIKLKVHAATNKKSIGEVIKNLTDEL